MLINKLDIMDQKQLDENETLITSVKILQIEMQPMTAEPDFAYLKHLHFVLFDELYSWAGEIRTINISKMRTAFCPADQVEATAQAILNDCRTVTTFADCRETSWSVSWPIYSINYLHPFREGNGRVQRLYFRQLAQWIDHSLNFAAVDSDRMMIATIRASAGVMDDLRQVFEEILK